VKISTITSPWLFCYFWYFFVKTIKNWHFSLCSAAEASSSEISSEVTSSSNVTISHDSPNQPRNVEFTKSGKIGHERSFQANWFDLYPWLHYDEELQAAFCFTCVKAAETNSLSTQTLSQGDAFLRKGYQNWKHALEKARGFQKHEMSQAHKEATIRYVKSSSNQPDVVDMVSSEAEKQRFKNRQMLLKILTNIRFLARQGLPLRGSWNKEYNIEVDSNFH